MAVDPQTVREYHEGGKIGMTCRRPLASREDLIKAYTPGVAIPVRDIAADPETLYRVSAKPNLVAVVSDGTAILGLGDLGAEASIPVMEGKAVLFKAFADVDAWPVPLTNCRRHGASTGPTDPQRLIETVCALAPMYGGINLEDIAAPACFEIEDRLDALLDIPVFHDDQWGTAVITLAGVLNFCRISDRTPQSLKTVINGAGAAGIRIAEMLRAAGVSRIVLCDSKGVIDTAREDLTDRKRALAVAPSPVKTCAGALRGADLFIGVSVADCLQPDDVRAMAPFPGIFAMANPDPEIAPDVVRAALGDAPHVMATGRSDYPNQVNNVLGFPFLFRGALDARARSISMEMKIAAAHALARLARQPVPESLSAWYPDENLVFGKDYLIPKPFDRRLLIEIPYAVAQAAVSSGDGAPGFVLETYRQNLEQRAKRMRPIEQG